MRKTADNGYKISFGCFIVNTRSVNLDAAAAHSLLPSVVKLLRGWDGYGLNPSSIHRRGQRAKALIEESREQIRSTLKAKGAQVIFTSGATESNNLAMLSRPLAMLEQRRDLAGANVVISALEHPCILACAERLAAFGVTVRVTSPLNLAAFADQVDEKTIFVSLMAVNNETGDLFDIRRFAQLCRAKNPNTIIHTDAAQVAGKFQLSFWDLGVDALTISGHKCGAMSGVGALIVRADILESPLLLGGLQEGRMRAGTEALLPIVSFGVALQELERQQPLLADHYATCRNQVLAALPPEVVINRGSDQVAPHIMNLRMDGLNANDCVVAMDLKGVCISSGSACSSGKTQPSHVLRALGLTDDQARSSIRVSFETHYPEEDIAYAADLLGNTMLLCQEVV